MNSFRIFMVLAGISGLIGVRGLEDKIFYDPFLDLFRRTDRKFFFPDFDSTRLILNSLFRFFLNLVFSVIVIQGIFWKKTWTSQAAFLMAAVFMITFPIYVYCIETQFSLGYLFAFYVRRFVIQPLVLLLLIPLFYLRTREKKKGQR
ncbi:MAG: exosortase F system-associated protein [Bergeyella sp.]|nr:exosortase F system-associated protein [Bergeyella sp.]